MGRDSFISLRKGLTIKKERIRGTLKEEIACERCLRSINKAKETRIEYDNQGKTTIWNVFAKQN